MAVQTAVGLLRYPIYPSSRQNRPHCQVGSVLTVVQKRTENILKYAQIPLNDWCSIQLSAFLGWAPDSLQP